MGSVSFRVLSAVGTIALALSGGCGEAPTIIYEPLRVISWTPQGGAVCIDTRIDLSITATFSKDVLPDTLNGGFRVAAIGADDLAATVDYAGLTRTASLRLDEALLPDSDYEIIVTTQVTDSAGGSLASDRTTSFRTRPADGECIQ